MISQPKRLMKDLIGASLVISFFLIVLYGNLQTFLSQFIIGRDFFIGGMLLLSLLMGVLNWRFGVKFVLFWALLEGAFRKWIFPEFSSILYFFKDFILFFSYIGFVFDPQKTKTKYRMNTPLVRRVSTILILLIAYGLLELFNPKIPHPMVGLIGFKVYFLYVPLVYVVPYLFKSEDDFILTLNRLIVCAIPIGLLGIIQFFKSPDDVLNIYVRDMESIALFGEAMRPRITTTFSYISGHTTFFLFIFCIVIGMLMSKKDNLFLIIIKCFALSSCVTNLFMSGSRGPLLQAAMALLLLVLFSMGNIVRFIRFHFFRLLLIGVFSFVVTYKLFPAAFESFFERISDIGYEEPQGRIKESIRFPLEEMKAAGGLGYGIGMTHQASSYFMDNDKVANVAMMEYEEEPERVMLELGWFGYFLFYLTKIAFCVFAFQLFKAVRKTKYGNLAFGFFAFVFVNLPMPLVFNHVLTVFFWFSIGFLLFIQRVAFQATQAA